jgi:Tfp pilus assembly protein PilF
VRRGRRTHSPLAGYWLVIAVVVLALVVATSCSDEGNGEDAGESLQRGLEAQTAGDLAQAEKDYLDVLEADPDNLFAFYNLGLIAQTRGNNFEAEENYRKALSADPEFTPALFNLAIVRAALGAPEEAISLYRQVIALEPQNADAHLNLGFLLRETGRRKEGNDEIELAVEIDPGLTGSSPSPTPEPASPLGP